jgi:hypothetical protein
VLAPLLIAVVNPQYVNVSALYTGAVLMAAAVMLVADDREEFPPSSLCLGLIYAGLAALKPIFALFALFHLPLAAMSVATCAGSWRAGAGWAVRTALWSAAALAPWIVLHAPLYFATQSPSAEQIPAASIADRLDLLSADRLVYGASYRHYALLAGIAVLAMAWGLMGGLRRSTRPQRRLSLGVVAASATLLLCWFTLLALGPQMAGFDHGLRYAIPFFLGIAPFVAVLATTIATPLPSLAAAAVPVFAILAAAVAFAPSFLERSQQAARAGSILAFSTFAQQPQFLTYNRDVLSDRWARYVRSVQNNIPPGEAFVGWISTPFRLDFRRNRVFDVDTAGLVAPWAALPLSARYVMWEYSGYGMRTPQAYAAQARGLGRRERAIAVHTLAFGRMLADLQQKGKTVFDDGRFAVFQIVR